MNIKHCITILLLFIFKFGLAQDSLRTNKVIFKFVPLAVFDFNATYQFALEHRIKTSWSLSEEFGYGMPKNNIFNILNSDKQGINLNKETYKFRLELRNYRRPIKAKTLTGMYFAYEFFFKQVNDKIARNTGRECINRNCAYYEFLEYPVNKYVYALNFKIGGQSKLFPESINSKIFIDYSAGLGVRAIINKHRYYGNLNDVNFSNDFILYSEYGSKSKSKIIPNLNLNFKLGYLLK